MGGWVGGETDLSEAAGAGWVVIGGSEEFTEREGILEGLVVVVESAGEDFC